MIAEANAAAAWVGPFALLLVADLGSGPGGRVGDRHGNGCHMMLLG